MYVCWKSMLKIKSREPRCEKISLFRPGVKQLAKDKSNLEPLRTSPRVKWRSSEPLTTETFLTSLRAVHFRRAESDEPPLSYTQSKNDPALLEI